MIDEEITEITDTLNANNKTMKNHGVSDNLWGKAVECIEFLQAENASLRERLEKAVELPFIVIDKKTGKEADEYEIALHEDWAKHLMYCDMEGFAIEQDGTLILLDEYGKFAYCLSDRFEVVPEARLAELKGGEK